MTEHKVQPQLPEMKTDYEDALSLVLGHRTSTGTAEEMRLDQDLVERYFVAISSSDLESALTEFRYTLNVTHRKEAVQALIAYFNWCWEIGKATTSDGTSLDTYVLRFSQIVFKRMVGIQDDSADRESLIPKWIDPNIALGWSNPAHRPPEDMFERDIAIAAYVEKLRREGCEYPVAKKRAAAKFDRKLPTVEKALIWDKTTESAFGERFCNFTTEDLDAMVSEYFEALHLKQTKKFAQ